MDLHELELGDRARHVRSRLVGLWLSRHCANQPLYRLPIRGNTQARISRHPSAKIIVTDTIFMGDSPTGFGYVARGAGISFELREHASLRIEGRMGIGDGTRLLLGVGAKISVGRGTVLDGNVKVIADRSVSIGRDCAIAWDVQIMDAPFRKLDGKSERGVPVIIEDEVWIGNGARVLSGVRVGTGSVIAAGAIVTKDVPARSLVGGVPARVIRSGVAWSRDTFY